MNKLPPKINNLYWLEKIGIKVPAFFIIDKGIINDIDSKIEKIIDFFQMKEISSVIIRSANCAEDLDEKSRAGFFKSSNEILLEDLTAEKILDLWTVNEKKARKIHSSGQCLFIQEYVKSAYSGVLFTQEVYDRNKARLMLSSSPYAITDGGSAEKNIVYEKQNDRWSEQGFLSKDAKRKLSNIISDAEKRFYDGADIELGVQGDSVRFYQVRPIIRNKYEENLLSEKQRLQDLFGSDFEYQLWKRNAFTQALGNLSPLSLSFYNYLLNSEELYSLLKKAKVIDGSRNENIKYRVLENIAGNTYYNLFQEKLCFPKQNGTWADAIRAVFVSAYEKIMGKESLELLNRKISISNTFAWFFLSGIYLQMFIDKEKQNYAAGSFVEKLKNTEIICGACEPHPQGDDNKSVDEFIKKYYYLGDHPYELANLRISEQNKDEILKKYVYFQKKYNEVNSNEVLGKKVQFWLRQRVLWKQKFLKLLFDCRMDLIQKYGDAIFKAINWEGIAKKGEKPLFQNDSLFDSEQKLSNLYSTISGKDFPFSKQEGKEVVITPGEINFQNIVHLTRKNDIRQYLNRYIAVDIFPGGWIPFIPEMKGIVLQEGNELSHAAITCREYKIPCRIIPSFFDERC